MCVITISRGAFSGGELLAECLAWKLEYRCVDREVIVERAAAHGVSQDVLRNALQKPPGFLERFSHKRYVYLTLIQAALTEEVQTGNAIYHGNAGHLLLRGGPNVLRTRIIAPLEFRIRIAQDRLKYGREEAVAFLQKADEDRQRWTHFLYGVNWGDPSLYDIVINLEKMGIEEACHVISGLARESCFEFTSESRRQMDDLVLASRIKADLVLDPKTCDLELDVRAVEGEITITGKVSRLDEVQEIERIAHAADGVTAVHLDELMSSTRD
jgi:two-component system, OmpR family, response regulator CpxR